MPFTNPRAGFSEQGSWDTMEQLDLASAQKAGKQECRTHQGSRLFATLFLQMGQNSDLDGSTRARDLSRHPSRDALPQHQIALLIRRQ